MEHIRLLLADCESAMATVEEILKMEEADQRIVITLLYIWWSERCAVREGEKERSAMQIAQMIKTYAEEFSAGCNSALNPVHRPTTAVWSKPPEGFVKLNCDGAFRSQDLSGGWGYVIRDSEGNVIGTGYGKLQKVLAPNHAELVACLQAVQRAVELGVQNIILATDAAEVVRALSTSAVDRSSASGLVWELKYLLHCNFLSQVVIHNPRSCNQVAHSLADCGARLGSGTVSVRDSIPVCTQTLLARDLASVA